MWHLAPRLAQSCVCSANVAARQGQTIQRLEAAKRAFFVSVPRLFAVVLVCSGSCTTTTTTTTIKATKCASRS